MYTSFFGLSRPPFSNGLDAEFYFPSPPHEEALASLIYVVQRRKGLVVVTGDVGTGKTLTMHTLFNRLDQPAITARLNPTFLSNEDLLQGVCREFRIPGDPNRDVMELLAALEDFLLTEQSADRVPLLIVDDAHTLNEEDLEHLRLISGLEAADNQLLQIIMFGQHPLTNILQHPPLKQLQQRIFRSIHIPPLDRALTQSYIAHRLQTAGSTAEQVFSDDAVSLIQQFTEGIPRLINNICDKALLNAFSEGSQTVEQSHVHAVIDEVAVEPSAQQGPGEAAQPETVEQAVAEVNEYFDKSIESRATKLDQATSDADRRIQELHRLLAKLRTEELKLQEQRTDADQKIREMHALAHAAEEQHKDKLNEHLTIIAKTTRQQQQQDAERREQEERKLLDYQAKIDSQMRQFFELKTHLQEQERGLGHREKTLNTMAQELRALAEKMDRQAHSSTEESAKLAQLVREAQHTSAELIERDQALSENIKSAEKHFAKNQATVLSDLEERRRAVQLKWEEMNELLAQFESRESGWARRLVAVDQRLKQFADTQTNLSETESKVLATTEAANANLAKQQAELMSMLRKKEAELLARSERNEAELIQLESQSSSTKDAAHRTMDQLNNAQNQLLESISDAQRELTDKAARAKEELELHIGKAHRKSETTITSLTQVMEGARSLLDRPAEMLEKISQQSEHVERMVNMVRQSESDLKQTIEDSFQSTQKTYSDALAVVRQLKEVQTEASNSLTALGNENIKALQRTVLSQKLRDQLARQAEECEEQMVQAKQAQEDIVRSCAEQRQTITDGILRKTSQQLQDVAKAYLDEVAQAVDKGQLQTDQVREQVDQLEKAQADILRGGAEQLQALAAQSSETVARATEEGQIKADQLQERVALLKQSQEETMRTGAEQLQKLIAQYSEAVAGASQEGHAKAEELRQRVEQMKRSQEHILRSSSEKGQALADDILAGSTQQLHTLSQQCSDAVAQAAQRAQAQADQLNEHVALLEKTQEDIMRTCAEKGQTLVDGMLSESSEQLQAIATQCSEEVKQAAKQGQAMAEMVRRRFKVLEKSQEETLSGGEERLRALVTQCNTDMDRAARESQTKAAQALASIENLEQSQNQIVQASAQKGQALADGLYRRSSQQLHDLAQECAAEVEKVTKQGHDMAEQLRDRVEHLEQSLQDTVHQGAQQGQSQVEEVLRKGSKQMQALAKQFSEDIARTAQEGQEKAEQMRERINALEKSQEQVLQLTSEQGDQQVARLKNLLAEQADSLGARLRSQTSEANKTLNDMLQAISEHANDEINRVNTSVAATESKQQTLSQKVESFVDQLESQTTSAQKQIEDAERQAGQLFRAMEELSQGTHAPAKLLQELRAMGSTAERQLQESTARLAELNSTVEKAGKLRSMFEAIIGATGRVADKGRGGGTPSPDDEGRELKKKIASLAQAVRKGHHK